jgi:hypothetical protein
MYHCAVNITLCLLEDIVQSFLFLKISSRASSKHNGKDCTKTVIVKVRLITYIINMQKYKSSSREFITYISWHVGI